MKKNVDGGVVYKMKYLMSKVNLSYFIVIKHGCATMW